MPSILVATASWTDRGLIDSGRFYPPEARTSEDRLCYYASQFPFVEVDSSYYSLPSVRNSALWAEHTGSCELWGWRNSIRVWSVDTLTCRGQP